jgi:FkbM family methyltransferase
MPGAKVIYDFGANNGDDIPYYLLKAERVVAVEANPVLVDVIRRRFAAQIRDGQLSVEHCALTVESGAAQLPFFVHKRHHFKSQLPAPRAEELAHFEQIVVPAQNVIDIVRRHGAPHYIKIDLEHYDQHVLRALFAAGLRPPYLSAETHTIEVLSLLVAVGGYRAFKMVNGPTVSTRFRDHPIVTPDGVRPYAFPEHSAGPFGEDIPGPWMTADNFFRVLSFAGLGWRDIHVSAVDAPDPAHMPQPRFEIGVAIDY